MKTLSATDTLVPAPQDGVGISKVTEYYLVSGSPTGVTTSTSGWSTDVQTPTASKRYLWNYEAVTYTDGNTVSTTPQVIGMHSEDGRGIKSIKEYYARSTSNSTAPTSWSTTPPTLTSTYKYLWNYEVVTYTDDTTSETTPAVIGVHGDKGDKGDDGADGEDGADGADGPIPYPCGSYDSSRSYTRNVRMTPVVELGGIYYVQLKVGTIKGINPQTDVANNGGNWGKFDMFKYIMSEVAFIDFGKLASAIFYGKYMFSQYGINASGSAVETEDGYKDFNYNDPMNASNSFRPNILLDFLSGKAWLNKVSVNGEVNATSGKVAGFNIEGESIVNSGFSNDATVIFRNDTHKTFAGIGGNVLPSSTGLRAVGRFENHDTEDFWATGTNYAMLVSAQGGRENVAIQLNGGSIACLALKTQIIGHDNVVQSSAPTTKYVTIGRDVGSVLVSTQFNWKNSSSAASYESKTRNVYLTLPTMDVYDDGHVIKIKRGSNDGSKVYISPGTSCRMVYNSSTGKYVRTYGTSYILYNNASYATPSSKLQVDSEGDAMELVYHRDLSVTINNTTYYGCWVQYKHPREW